jgi:hypothetical protein
MLIAPPAAAQSYRVVVHLRPYPGSVVLDTIAQGRNFDTPAGSAFEAAAQAMRAHKIPLAVRDPVRGVVGHLKLNRTGRLGSAPISRYLDCGVGLAGPNADTQRVTVAVAALIDSLPGDQSRVRIGLVGASIDMAGHSADWNRCATSGVLENLLLDAVGEQLAAEK